MKLIDKDALVQYLTGMAESACCDENIERIIRKFIIPHIDSLEVKDGDYTPIDKDFERDAVQFCLDNGLNTTPRIAKMIAKHFFELGMQVSNK